MTQRKIPRRHNSKENAEVSFGYYAKDSAVRIAAKLQAEGVACRVLLNRKFAHRHRSATAVSPALRRGLSYRDIKMGYTLRVAAKDDALARAAIRSAGLEVMLTGRGSGARVAGDVEVPDFDADPRWCPQCEKEVAPKTDTCPECGTATVNILQRKSLGGGSKSVWAIALLLVVLVALGMARLF